MMYLLKVNGPDWAVFKQKRNGISLMMRLNAWISHYAEVGFSDSDFLKIDEIESYAQCKFDGKPAAFTLIIEKQVWSKFKKECGINRVSANWVINQFIKRYNANGGFVEVTMKL